MSIREAAFEYLSKGWSPIRLRAREKIPAGPWALYQEEKATHEEVENWPDESNVGIVTGGVSGILVVDFDPKNGGDADAWLREYPTPCVVDTGSGGVHAYYRYADGVGNCAGLLPGVDVRGEGGYVVAPPSVHPSGGTYRWRERGEPAFIDGSVVQKVMEHRQNDVGWVGELLKGVEHGGRDDVCAKLAGWLYSKSMGHNEAVAFLAVWNSKNKPPLTHADLEKTVKSVYSKASRATSTAATATRPPSSKFELQPFGSYMAEFSDSEVPWLIPSWMPARTIAFVISPPGTYKTWSILDLAVSVATGTHFLGIYPVKETGPVFLIQQEDYHGQTVERLSVIVHERYMITASENEGSFEVQTPPKVPIFVHTERRFRFDDKKAMADFREAVELHKPKLVIIDPLYSTGDTDDFMASLPGHMFIFKDLRDKYGTTFLVCHHTKKSGDAKSRDRLWGSQFLNAFLETGWQLSLETENTVRFHRHFKSAANPNDTIIKFDIGTLHGDYRYKPKEVEEEEVREETRSVNGTSVDPVFTWLNKAPGNYFAMKEICQEVDRDKSVVSRRLASLIKEGLIERRGQQYGVPSDPKF